MVQVTNDLDGEIRMEASEELLTIAELAIALAGFSGVVDGL